MNPSRHLCGADGCAHEASIAEEAALLLLQREGE